MPIQIPHSKPYIGSQELDAVAGVLKSGALSQGNQVRSFEEECAQVVGRKYAVAVSSGTAALHLALGAIAVPKDEWVAIPSFTCPALATAVTLHGGRSSVCDIGADFNIDAETITEHVKYAIVPHMFGAPAKMPEKKIIVEDIAQFMGGGGGKATPVSITSFYATKLITTGEGGMLFTNDEGIAQYARDRRDYDNRDDFKMRYPYKMTEIQAVMGRVQLRRLPKFVERRREIAARYHEALNFLPVRLPNPEGHVFFRYVIGTDRRAEIETYLQKRGIEAKRPIYRPMHLLIGGGCPKSQMAFEETLSLPIYPALLDGELRHIVDCLLEFFN